MATYAKRTCKYVITLTPDGQEDPRLPTPEDFKDTLETLLLVRWPGDLTEVPEDKWTYIYNNYSFFIGHNTFMNALGGLGDLVQVMSLDNGKSVADVMKFSKAKETWNVPDVVKEVKEPEGRAENPWSQSAGKKRRY